MRLSRVVVVGIVVAGIALDLAMKLTAEAYLTYGSPVTMFPGLDLTLGFNPGIAFGLFPATSNFSSMMLIAVQAVLTAVLASLAFRADDPRTRLGISLMVSGAVANIIDRVPDGLVTDYVDVHWDDWHWPAFNVADALICIGVAIFLFSTVRYGSAADTSSRSEIAQ